MVGPELGGDPALWAELPENAGAERPETELPAHAAVCSCNNVTAGAIRDAVTEHACHDVAAVKGCTRAGTSRPGRASRS